MLKHVLDVMMFGPVGIFSRETAEDLSGFQRCIARLQLNLQDAHFSFLAAQVPRSAAFADMRWPALCLFAGVGLFAASPCADAGWVIIKNETQQAVLVVEIAGTPNKPIQGKPVKLQPGETYREFHAAAGQKTFAVYDAAKPAASLGQQSLSWGKDDAAFAIRPDGGAAVKVASAEKK